MKYNMNEIEEAVMDAIILLDPPHGPRNDSNSRLSLSCIQQAHDILLSAASSITMIDHHRNHHSLYQGETPHRHGHEQVATVADLYRSIVVSANLLVEVLQQDPTRQREEDVRIHYGSDEEDDKNAFPTAVIKNSSREQCIPSSPKTSKDDSTTCIKTWQQSSSSIRQIMKSLHSTIIQSILLLKRLSHLSYMSNPKTYLDWHDDLLPKSRHSLLQECFQRKIMMDVEENVVFGLEDRLVSLNEDEYDSILAQMNSTNNEHESADTTFGSCNSNNNFETCLEDVKKTSKEDSDDHDDDDDDDDSDMLQCHEAESLEEIEMTWNAKELEKEESDLFDIALPGYNYPQNGGEKHAKKKRKRMSNDQDDQVSYNYLSRTMIQQLEEIGLFHHVEVPFYGMPCIMKQGWLILRLEETINTNLITKNVETAKDGNLSERKDIKKCHVTLLANGVLLIEFHSDCETIKMDIIGNIKMFTVTAITRCTASPSNHTFYFHVNNVIECKNKNDEQSTKERSDKDHQKESFLSALLLGVDVEKGGSLMDGYRWMTAIEDCANFMSKVQEVKEDLLEQTWKKL